MAPVRPADQRQAAARARRLEWITLAARVSALVLLGLTARSQAIQALWAKNLLALLPPAAFLAADRLERRTYDPRFPYGLYRANIVAHLVNGLLLILMAIYLLNAATGHLLAGTPLQLGPLRLAGLEFWSGWLLCAALAYAGGVPLLLSRLRRPLAQTLHDKALLADSAVGRAEWQSAAAAAVGLIAVHAGLWWADYAAAGLIALQILRFGWRNTSQAARDLVDERPRRLDGSFDPLPERIEALLQELDWVSAVEVRLRDEGRLLTGEARVRVAPSHDPISVRAVQAAIDAAQALDWRLHDFAVIPLPDPGPR